MLYIIGMSLPKTHRTVHRISCTLLMSYDLSWHLNAVYSTLMNNYTFCGLQLHNEFNSINCKQLHAALGLRNWCKCTQTVFQNNGLWYNCQNEKNAQNSNVFSLWAAGRAVTTGLHCTKGRRLLTGRRTGWTTIRRSTVGGTTVMRTPCVYDTDTTASMTEIAPLNSNTHVKWRQVQVISHFLLILSIGAYFLLHIDTNYNTTVSYIYKQNFWKSFVNID